MIPVIPATYRQYGGWATGLWLSRRVSKSRLMLSDAESRVACADHPEIIPVRNFARYCPVSYPLTVVSQILPKNINGAIIPCQSPDRNPAGFAFSSLHLETSRDRECVRHGSRPF